MYNNEVNCAFIHFRKCVHLTQYVVGINYVMALNCRHLMDQPSLV